MPELNSRTWDAVVSKKWIKSSEFSALDIAVRAYLANSKSTINLTNLRAKWNDWVRKLGKSYKASDRYIPNGALDALAAICGVNFHPGLGTAVPLKHAVNPPLPVAGATAGAGGPLRFPAVGWKYKRWTHAAYAWTTAVPATNAQPELTMSEVGRINEAMARARQAAEIARDAMISLKGRNNLAARVLPAADRVYKDYFRDPALIGKAAENFSVLALAFSRNPTVVDVRNTVYGLTCYAACFQANRTSRTGGALQLTATTDVEIFLGRSFFTGVGSYLASSDATVCTLIHEFAHGCFNAVDAPPVRPDMHWQLTPNTDWSSPDNSIQSSTVELDQRLAVKEPRAAIVNADNYGQFAKDMLLLARR